MTRMKISGMGMFVPENVVTNHDLEQMMDTNDEWIQQRTGIQERRWVSDPEMQSTDMAERASLAAMAEAGCEAKDIDLIIFATLSPEFYFPGNGVLLQTRLGAKDVPALDVRNQCSGFLYGLSVANGMICSGMYKRILLVGSELHSRGLRKTTEGRGVAVIFGDGAGAAVLEPTEDDKGVIDITLGADGRFADELSVFIPTSRYESMITHADLDEGRQYPHMNGNKVFKHAVTHMYRSVEEICQRNQIAPKDLDVLIAHQANLRINEFVGRALDIEPKVFNNIQRYGNTTAASIPIAMREALDQGFLKPGHLLCLCAFGSGFTWGSALIRM